MNEKFPDSDNQPSAPIIDETDEWPSIKEVRGKFNNDVKKNLRQESKNLTENITFTGDWSKAGAVFSAEDLALLDSAGRPQQVSLPK